MTAPMDWATFSEADEESRQTLLKRAVKIEPSLQVALASSAKKVRKRHDLGLQPALEGLNAPNFLLGLVHLLI